MIETGLERADREECRWRILRVLDAGRPRCVADTLIWRALADIDMPLTLEGIRRELKYLEGKKLVNLRRRRGDEVWQATLTSDGVDYVDFTSDDLPGISRPPKYWG